MHSPCPRYHSPRDYSKPSLPLAQQPSWRPKMAGHYRSCLTRSVPASKISRTCRRSSRAGKGPIQAGAPTSTMTRPKIRLYCTGSHACPIVCHVPQHHRRLKTSADWWCSGRIETNLWTVGAADIRKLWPVAHSPRARISQEASPFSRLDQGVPRRDSAWRAHVCTTRSGRTRCEHDPSLFVGGARIPALLLSEKD